VVSGAMVAFPEDGRPEGWAPKGARLVQLREGRKRPATSHGHLSGVIADDFVALGQNIGIILDGMFALVDTDRPGQSEEWDAKLPQTWMQATPRGVHRLYRVPQGFEGSGQVKWAAGEVKARGYAVAPGSWIDPNHEENSGHPGGHYRLLDARDPVLAPQWLLDVLTYSDSPQRAKESILVGDERDFIPDGERDNALTEIAGFLRRKGFSESALSTSLCALVESGLVEQPPGREITDHDCERIARSIAHKPVGEAEVVLLPAEWRTGADVDDFPEVVDWLLPGFVPSVGLTLLYGDGKVGKSKWAAWLAAHVTKTGQSVVFIASGEETFKQFVDTTRLCGGIVELVLEYPQPEKFRLPNSVPALAEAIAALGHVGLVYIDAVYSQFDEANGSDAATRARSRLRPLAQAAIDGKWACLGTMHENKNGGSLGSTEMRNVARSFLHASRRKGGDLTIRSAGCNYWAPDYGVSFPGDAVPILDSHGSPLVFEDIFGEKIEQANWRLRLGEKVGEEIDPDAETLDVDKDVTQSRQNAIDVLL
jgi:hypothetical protein